MSKPFITGSVTNIVTNNISCAICWECISQNKNCSITDCGHKFHTSCLLKSCYMLDFSCPICRNVLLDKTREQKQDDFINIINNYLDSSYMLETVLRDNALNLNSNIDISIARRIIPMDFSSLSSPPLVTYVNNVNQNNIIDRFINLPFHNANH